MHNCFPKKVEMQRTSAGFYQSLMNRSEFISIAQMQNTTSVGSLSQPHHWKKKILNKVGTNKRRQNPTRQAAVRSFKKYQFSNQDFLLRKYLRSIKKELRPKQCEPIVPTTSSTISVSGRQLVDNYSRRVPGVSDLRCKISNPSNIRTSTAVSSLSNKKMINQQDMEPSSKLNKYQEFNTDQEIKLCSKRNWPTHGFERPTLENIEIESTSVVLDDGELKEILNESGNFISDYCKSLRELSDIMSYSDYDYSAVDSLSHSNNIDLDLVKQSGRKNNQTTDKFFYNICCDSKTASNNEDASNDDDSSDDKSAWDSTNNNIDISKSKFHDHDSDDNSEDDVDEEEEEEAEEEEDDDENDGDDDDDDDEDDECGENSVEENNQRVGIRVGDKSLVTRHSSELISIYKNDDKNSDDNKTNQAKDVVLSIDTTDSSSVSSSLDNTSLSTETCTDNQTNNSDNQDTCDFKNKINSSSIQCDDDELEIIDILDSNYDVNKPHRYIKIRKEDSPVSVPDGNLMYAGCLKESQPNILPEHIVKHDQSLQPLVSNRDGSEKLFQSNRCEEKMEFNDKKYETLSLANDKHKRYIKIGNREHPITVLDSNPTLFEYLKETQPYELPERIAETRFTQNESKTTVHGNFNDQKTQSKHQILKTSGSMSDLQKPQQYIKIRNRDYPISILENNPTLIEYLKETQPHTLPKSMIKDIEESLPSVENYGTRKTNIERISTDKKIQSVGKINKTIYHDKINLRTMNQPLKHCSSSEKMQSIVQNKKVRRMFSLEKETYKKNNKKHDILSSVCSLEDGLAFLDNQNDLPQGTNVHHLSTSTIQNSETITLYNHSTSCTLPYPGLTSLEVLKNQMKKSSRHQQRFSGDQALPNSVASQADLSFGAGGQSFPHHDGQFQCSKCKLVDTNLKESLKNSFIHINGLITGSVVLNSLITGERVSDNAINLLSNLNYL